MIDLRPPLCSQPSQTQEIPAMNIRQYSPSARLTHFASVTLAALLSCSTLACDDAESRGEALGGSGDTGGAEGEPEPEPDDPGAPGESEGGRFGEDDEDGDEDGDDGSSEPLGLCSAVDILFVIDNSDAMAGKQSRLLASAVGFIDDAAQLLPSDTSFHVGVVTTDSADLRRSGLDGQACPFMAETASPFVAHSGPMTTALDAGLACAANVGTAGSPNERPIEMALTALGPGANLAEAANAGFVRDDAVLVLVLLSDEEDDHETVTQWGSAGDPEDWADELSDIVFGVDERVVVLSLVGHEKPNACPGFQWDGKEGAELAPRLIEFTRSFAHGMVGDVCAPSYGNFFADAAFAVADACGG